MGTEFRVYSKGFQGLGLRLERVRGLRFRAGGSVLGLGVSGQRFQGLGFGFSVQSQGFKGLGSG